MVRLSRAASLTLSWQDQRGRPQLWEHVDRAHSELIQHEVDHLNGILAIDHAQDRDALIAREAYEADRSYYG
jgi:peptide deformylase